MYRIYVTTPKTISPLLLWRECLRPHSSTWGTSCAKNIAGNVGQLLFYQIMHVRPITVECASDVAAARSSRNNKAISIRVCSMLSAYIFPVSPLSAFVAFTNFFGARSRR